ncbi:DegT/DnrJ/EryC1/StrS family aminotransferase [Rugamonas sp. CCM 8940]|uniref:DegT/DnrJ/EryC1/StrS family aminotransferase n=1 Tax=Rugamonas sp. CCM 8940 TaxID=2765359 RepID=UPI0018F28CB7|nr:DegT/DnrJ/EryC1/StrS family aminotransferase [Rugamonas sp. CCM 8940]MBJ7311213.1 DegT/DnrJ/EryC1/StrS family aminotransferase [Rugamonas sp. CCM 8940]
MTQVSVSAEASELSFPAWPQFAEKTLSEVLEPLRSSKVNYWTGTRGKEFEEKFAAWAGAEMAVSCSSGTAALHSIIGSMNIGPGDEVIVPSYSFIASSFCILQAGAIPVFCDVGLDHTIDPAKIAALITPRTKAVIVVHLYGVVCDMEPIMALAEQHGLKVIEDAAQCIGGEYQGRKVGTLGHAAAFSFCQSKHFTTGGEGGMITTNDSALGWECRSFRDHGYDIKRKMDLLALEQTDFYIHNRIGFNFRMTEIQSIIGINELERFDEWNLPRRKQLARQYDAALQGLPGITALPFNSAERQNAYWWYPILLDTEALDIDAAALCDLLKEAGVPASKIQWPEAYGENVYRNLAGFGSADFPFKSSEYTDPAAVQYRDVICPTARSLLHRTLSLHLHPTWEASHVQRCIEVLTRLLAEHRK